MIGDYRMLEEGILSDPTVMLGEGYLIYGEMHMQTLDDTPLSLEDFVELETERIQRFADAYAHGLAHDNDAFPPEMTDFEWVAAYESWVETIYTEEEDVTPSNENNSN